MLTKSKQIDGAMPILGKAEQEKDQVDDDHQKYRQL